MKRWGSWEKKRDSKPKSTELGSYFKGGWPERHLEIYFPSQHTPHFPWKAYEWQGEVEDEVPEVVQTLCHVTHKKEFDKICELNPGSYTLKFNKKKGKSGYEKNDGSPLGYTFTAADGIKTPPDERSEYKYVDSSTDLLPGSYLWWSIDNSIQNKPHRSQYGSVAIYGRIEHLFEHYQKSLPRDPLTGKLPKIELRIGGTLRYKFEICYVIIVCKEKEPMLPYDKYPVWPEGRKIHFDLKDAFLFIDPIKVKNIKRAKHDDSWSHHVFGFHFPDDQHHMICPKSCFKEKETIHDNYMCIKKRPEVPGGKWLCPDIITNNSQKKREMSNNSLDDERESKRQRCDDEEM
ncbi:PREDICTED: uncharacterized protein LOC109581148 [Amphimedon queenslandica]|uniref:Uncharacterized protein n=1 Tax=Amphimedon queenslandica TaxID=400682 RepID=A0A1X7V6U5_AMPQE|nr:PREDICTED: uncharacterized protein LOC109581148 [Amphimedon queenslandica]|eukprot:XP_019850536.1 PREDICTED: uncharacterized protein LOC109581148 [Amphimedon queenslandica]